MINIYIFFKRCITKIRGILYKKTAIYQLKKANANFENDIIFTGAHFLGIAGQVKIGKGFICRTGPEGFSKIVVNKNASLYIGEYSGVNNITLLCHNNIHIGNHVNIGNGTYIYDSNFHSLDWEDRADRNIDIQNAKTAPIHIGDYVFIGARCIIGKGITIGDKSVVAAGSVVTRDIPSGEIWGGNPAKFIKKID